jgi:pimeloyl-ACP methyl ester carboxylesterase
VAQVVRAPGGRRLAVEIIGDPTGKAVFLMHGTPGSLLGPRPRGIFLYRLGIRLISYNRPGYPGSDRFEGRIVADAAADVEAIADHFEIDKFSVIGRSGGAPHALACAADKRLRDRLICTAALSSLAPCDAGDLDWYAGMVESNVQAYQDAAESDLRALIATIDQHAKRIRDNSQGLLDTLRPELADADRQVIGDIALRRIIARTHAEALRESVDGWVDDVLALSRRWAVTFSDITEPVLLWHGGDDMFSPANHTQWLAGQIPGSELDLRQGAAHFEAIKILPEILRWVLSRMNAAAPPAFAPADFPPADFPPPPPSEGQWGDHAEKSAVGGGRGDVGVLRPKQFH